jgi:hypothetical protein
VRQPLGEHIDLDQADADLLAFARSFEAKKGRRAARNSPSGKRLGRLHDGTVVRATWPRDRRAARSPERTFSCCHQDAEDQR